MTILDRYLMTQLLGAFLFGVAAFTSIIAGSSVLFPIVSESVAHGIPMWKTIQIFIYRIPSILSVTFPMSILLASILCFSRLSSDGETIAFRSAGVSLYRLIFPVLLFGVALSIVNVVFNEYVVPKASTSSELLFQSLKSTTPNIQKNINVTEYDSSGLPQRIINVREVDNNLLRDVTVAEYDQGQLARLIRAKDGAWKKSGGWQFNDGIMHSFSPSSIYEVMVVEFAKEFIDIPIDIFNPKKYNKSAQDMSAKELKKEFNIR